ncbi:MAG: glycosyltransferase family 4 protein [Bacteroidota bacterium]
MTESLVLQQRLCQVLYSGLGGHGSVVFSLISADVQHDFEHSLVFYGIEPTRDAYLTLAEKYGVSTATILKNRGLDLKSWRKVYRQLYSSTPAVILLHSTNLILPVARYCRKHHAKLIVVEHTPDAMKRRIEHQFSRWSAKHADQIVVLSRDYKQEYTARYGSHFEAKLKVINNGIDVDVYQPVSQPENDNRIIISMIGRFSSQKDQLTLIRAIHLLNNPSVRLILAGSGDQLAACEAYVTENDLTEQVQFPGLLNEEELVLLLHQTTIYVHASLGETMPTSLMQAMSCRLPVIGSDIPGINNLITHNEDGLLVVKSNPEALSEQLNYLIENAAIRQELAKAAREKAVEQFSHHRMFDGYRQLINSL